MGELLGDIEEAVVPARDADPDPGELVAQKVRAMARAQEQVPEGVVDRRVLRDVLAEGAGVGKRLADSLLHGIGESVADRACRRHLLGVGAPDVGKNGGKRKRV